MSDTAPETTPDTPAETEARLDPNVAAAQARQVAMGGLVANGVGAEIGRITMAKITAEAEAAVLRQQLATVFVEQDAMRASLDEVTKDRDQLREQLRARTVPQVEDPPPPPAS